jgi:NAD(P)-dependent dehydrogenase (short-subunit alcohol dehydrogenase family)
MPGEPRNQPALSDLKGRTCLVTGATHGIGRATAEALARLGADVLVHGRDSVVVGVVCREIVRASGNASVNGVVADFASLAAVRRLATEIQERQERLDVLVNNAGTSSRRRRLTNDGFEWLFGVNHLAPFVLTNLLLDKLKANAPARVVTVSSMAYRRGALDLEDPNWERRKYDSLGAYGASKLANILFTRELARRLEGTRVTTNCLHPGVVATNIFNQLGWIGRAFTVLARPLLLSPKNGARTTVHLAASPEVAEISGRFFDRCREKQLEPNALDDTKARALWELSERLSAVTTRPR